MPLLLKFVKNPKSVGTIVPSSRFLARAMASYVPPHASVLEVGAGTGVITMELIKRGLTSDRLLICEYDQDLCCLLKERFLGYSVLCEDACALDNIITPHSMDCVVSGLPLRNFSTEFKQKLVKSLRTVVKPGGYLIQFTYGFSSPLPFLKGKRQAYIMANIPPAFIWQYELT